MSCHDHDASARPPLTFGAPTIGWDVIESIVWYFFCIETQGRTLEELDEIFSAPRAVAASIAKKKAR